MPRTYSGAWKPEPAQKQGAYIGYLSVILASTLFGSVFTVAKLPLATIDPLALSAVVYIISGLALIPFARASFRLEKRELRYMVFVTAFGAVAAPVLLLLRSASRRRPPTRLY